MKRFLTWVLSTLAALMLAFAFIGVGLLMCAGPDSTTRILAENTSNYDSSPLTKDQLVNLAVATKRYTVESHDRAELEDAIRDANSGRNTNNLGERYTLPTEALEHLDDVHAVLVHAAFVFGAIAIVACVLTVLCGLWKGMALVGRTLVEAGSLCLVILLSCGITAVLNFDLLFGGMHALLFEAGTWTFSGDSLLICMYPQNFWIGMGLVLVVAAALLSIAAIVIGLVLKRVARKRNAIPYPFAQQGYDILYF